MANILIVAAHPDDETLGVGGTILRHKKNGDKIFWLIITNISESQGFSSERVLSRQKEIEIVSNLYNFNEVIKFDIPTSTLTDSNLVDLISKISKLFERIEPEIIYTMNRSDAHSDHRIIFQSIMACTKSFRYPYIKKVLMYECLSETEFSPTLPENVFQPNYFVDISQFFEKKVEIMKIYDSELDEHPFPRSCKNIEALATFRGAYAGVKYAEAFQLIKLIEK
jgi:LmbE family N-acetylglucosaminyl deacetylase